MRMLVLLAAIGCSMVLAGCYAYDEGAYYGHPLPGYSGHDGYPGYYFGEPYYIYGDVHYYSSGGRYFYYRNQQRYYVNSLPYGGRYSHGATPRRSGFTRAPEYSHGSARYRQQPIQQVRRARHQPADNARGRTTTGQRISPPVQHSVGPQGGRQSQSQHQRGKNKSDDSR
jgi:hypothetical protein